MIQTLMYKSKDPFIEMFRVEYPKGDSRKGWYKVVAGPQYSAEPGFGGGLRRASIDKLTKTQALVIVKTVLKEPSILLESDWHAEFVMDMGLDPHNVSAPNVTFEGFGTRCSFNRLYDNIVIGKDIPEGLRGSSFGHEWGHRDCFRDLSLGKQLDSLDLCDRDIVEEACAWAPVVIGMKKQGTWYDSCIKDDAVRSLASHIMSGRVRSQSGTGEIVPGETPGISVQDLERAERLLEEL